MTSLGHWSSSNQQKANPEDVSSVSRVLITSQQKYLPMSILYQVTIGPSTLMEVRGMMNDTVNHPSHYTAGAIETINVIKSVCNGQELTPFEGLLLGNIIKYVSRFTHKNGVEDLRKAAWYLERLIGEQEARVNDKL